MNNEEKIARLLTRNVEEVIERPHLEAALKSGKKLRVKLGIDPTSPDLHLGHAVALGKLREFQELGHKVVFIIGDFTGTIGDPSGRTEGRSVLTEATVRANMKQYLAQAGKILDVKKAEIVHNSEWFKKKGVAQIMALLGAGSMQQVLHRADFQKRLADGSDVTLLELLYPLLQGYDSVMVKADVELGGTDQLLNLLAGRKIQRHFGMKEQDVLTVPLLEGLDGVKKMSKSIGNYVGLNFEPADMFGKIMSLPDALMEKYFIFCTDLDEDEVKQLVLKMSPRERKAYLAREIVKRYHGEKKAAQAEENFNQLFSKRGGTGGASGAAGADIPTLQMPKSFIPPVDLIVIADPTQSRGAARRLIEQGGLKLNDAQIKDPAKPLALKAGDILKVGKRHFFKLKK
jgi:tyrosyl-tRNA synthetase